MIRRDTLLTALNSYLNIAAAPEHNGLQVEGRAEVSKIVFGVSANMALFEAAKKAGADLIITHHGLIWDNAQPLTGVFGARAAFLLKNNINLAAYHLPLDMHPLIGNNAQLAKQLGLKNITKFGDYHGHIIGARGVLPKAIAAAQLARQLGGDFVPAGAGAAKVRDIAIVSGGGHSLFGQAQSAGADLFITGSRDEYIYEMAKESKTNFLAIGHYESEKLGVQALMAYAAKKFKVATQFIDIPNPF